MGRNNGRGGSTTPQGQGSGRIAAGYIADRKLIPRIREVGS